MRFWSVCDDTVGECPVMSPITSNTLTLGGLSAVLHICLTVASVIEFKDTIRSEIPRIAAVVLMYTQTPSQPNRTHQNQSNTLTLPSLNSTILSYIIVTKHFPAACIVLA